jgi:hypothetical protein
MTNTGYPYDGFEEMYPVTTPTPEWYGHGHKHHVYNKTPIKHLILVDGQQTSEIDVQDPDEPLDHVVADQLRGQPAERPHWPVASVLTLIPTIRPNARLDMEYGQFQHPDTRPAVLEHHRRGRWGGGSR